MPVIETCEEFAKILESVSRVDDIKNSSRNSGNFKGLLIYMILSSVYTATVYTIASTNKAHLELTIMEEIN